MSYVAISFPVSGQSVTKKQESLKRAQKFAKEIGLENSDITAIREGVYGCIVSDDVDDKVLNIAKKHNAKVLPFVETDTSGVNVNEGQWLVIESATAGIRFEMRGTDALNPVEGKILPGKYFVLGLQESNGGTHATLGRVDRLADLGKGTGKYVYNVDVSLLKAAMASATAEKTESKKAESKKKEKNESAHIRTDAILDMLLENDPYVLAESKRAADKEAAEQVASRVIEEKKEDSEPTMEELIQESLKAAPAEKTEINESTEEAKETTEEKPEETNAEEVETEDAEEFDPEVYAESRRVIAALQEAGIDVDALSEEELDEALKTFYSEDEQEEAQEPEATENVEEPATEKAEDAKAEETKSEEEPKEESSDDDAFEVTKED